MKRPLKTLNPAYFKRYRDFARLLVKHGEPDLAERIGLTNYLKDDDVPDTTRARAEDLAADLEKMGPTFVKLGQLLSTRADMLPIEYLEALSRLQDSVAPFPYAEVERIVEEELGTRIKKAFAHFEEGPLASASLGQVHRATLPSGRVVAVKVQRPGIEEEITHDFEAMAPLAAFLDTHTHVGAKYEFSGLLEDLRTSILRELDYREEAGSLKTMAENLADHPHLVVPLPVDDYTTTRVLTMDYVRGRKITAIGPLAQCELQGDTLVSELFHAYLDQILVHGFFHADPHPGNVFLTEDREHLALIDMGMICQITPTASATLLKLLLALSEGLGEEAAGYALDLSTRKPDFDHAGFTAAFSTLALDVRTAGMGEQKFGAIFLMMQKAAAENGVRLARELRFLGKTILNLEAIGDVLADDFDPQRAIRKHATKVMRGNVFDAVRPTQLLKQAAEMKEVVERLPRRLNQLLDLLTENQFRINIDALDEDRLMHGFEKVANRITVGLVLAAMIIGAALMMNIESSFTLLGYPGLAIVLLAFALVIGGSLVITIVWNDIYGQRR